MAMTDSTRYRGEGGAKGGGSWRRRVRRRWKIGMGGEVKDKRRKKEVRMDLAAAEAELRVGAGAARFGRGGAGGELGG